MSVTIARAKELLADTTTWYGHKIDIIGLLAIAIVMGHGEQEEIEEARGIVAAYWAQMGMTR